MAANSTGPTVRDVENLARHIHDVCQQELAQVYEWRYLKPANKKIYRRLAYRLLADPPAAMVKAVQRQHTEAPAS